MSNHLVSYWTQFRRDKKDNIHCLLIKFPHELNLGILNHHSIATIGKVAILDSWSKTGLLYSTTIW